MELFTCGEAVIDKCPRCQGIWFDAREIGVFRETLQARDLEPLKVLAPDPESTSSVPVIRACPRDGEILSAFTYSYNSKARLHRCDRCDGIWSPFVEILHLVEAIKLGQSLEPHLRAVGRELAEHHRQVEHWRSVGKVSQALRLPVYGYGRYGGAFGIILPIATDQPVTGGGLAPYSIILANLLIYGILGRDSLRLAAIPAEVTAGRHLETLFTSMFAHASFLHLAGNLFFLWLFGKAVEWRVGAAAFFLLYFSTGLLADAAYLLTHTSSTVPLLGASGAISGILGAYLAFFPYSQVKTIVVRAIVDVPAWFFLSFWFIGQLYSWLRAEILGRGGIAFSAHIAGFISGFMIARLFYGQSSRT